MADIYGRSVLRFQPGVTIAQVKKLIRDAIAKVTGTEIKKIVKDEIGESLNLAEVDTGEIVVFENEKGKLKTSNVSFDDLLMKNPTAENGTVVIFKDGKLAPDVLITSITDKVSNFEDVERMNRLLNKFFSKRDPPPRNFKARITDVVLSLDNLVTKLDEIPQIKKSIEDTKSFNDVIKEDFPKIAERLDKIKISHEVKDVKNIVYVVKSGEFEYIHKGDEKVLGLTVRVNGIYRLTIISPEDFFYQ